MWLHRFPAHSSSQRDGTTPRSCAGRCGSASAGLRPDLEIQRRRKAEVCHSRELPLDVTNDSFECVCVCLLNAFGFVNCYRESGRSQGLINWDNWCLQWGVRKLTHNERVKHDTRSKKRNWEKSFLFISSQRHNQLLIIKESKKLETNPIIQNQICFSCKQKTGA